MSLRTKSRIPASTAVTAARLVSMVSVSVPSVFSGRMAFIVIPLFALSAARVSPARRRQPWTRASDFGRNLAEVRQGRSIRGLCRGVWLRESERTRQSEGAARSVLDSLGSLGGEWTYQLFLKPAVRLLLIAPCEFSRTEPETVTLSNSFCSAPTLRSHLSSVVDSDWPAVMLVPVSVRVTLADCSVP